MSNITISTTAQQKGFGKARYKSVAGLTKEEKAAISDGKTIAFKSRLSGGSYGTEWRVVLYSKGRYYPRVPDAETLAVLDGIGNKA